MNATESPQKLITVSFAVAEFLHSIFDSTPMRTLDEIEMCIRCHPVTKEAMARFHEQRKALFDEYAVATPRGNSGKGGGKVRAADMEMQIPEAKKQEYHDKFLELAGSTVDLVFSADDIAVMKDKWILPEWLIERVERFNTANGIDTVTHQKVLMQCRYALEDAKDYVAPETDGEQGQDGGDQAAA